MKSNEPCYEELPERSDPNDPPHAVERKSLQPRIISLTNGARVQVEEHLKSGKNGSVYRGIYLSPPREGLAVAIKFIHFNKAHSFIKEVEAIYDEFFYTNRHVVRPFGSGYDDEGSMCFLVMELGQEDLHAYLQKKRGQLSHNEALSLMLEVACDMEALHLQQVVHGDLRASNIVRDDHGRWKLTDFGLSVAIGDPTEEVQITHAVPRPWQAPEIKRRMRRSALLPCDVYSFGIVMREILTQADFGCGEAKGLDRLPLLLSIKIPDMFTALMDQCLDPHPERRPSFTQVIRQLQQIAGRRKLLFQVPEYRPGVIGTFMGDPPNVQGFLSHLLNSSEEDVVHMLWICALRGQCALLKAAYQRLDKKFISPTGALVQLLEAARKGHLSTVRFLVTDLRASTSTPSYARKLNAFELSIAHGHLHVARWLWRHGGRMRIREHAQEVFRGVCQRGGPDMASFFIENFADESTDPVLMAGMMHTVELNDLVMFKWLWRLLKNIRVPGKPNCVLNHAIAQAERFQRNDFLAFLETQPRQTG